MDVNLQTSPINKSKKTFIKRFWWPILITVILLAGVVGVLSMVERRKSQENEFPGLENERRITLSLPFSRDNEPFSIMPYGETINHPGKIGHPGLDFFWEKRVPLLSSADGRVQDITTDNKLGIGTWTVVVVNDYYQMVYGNMGDYNRNLKMGNVIKRGDLIGYPMNKADIGLGKDFAFHWGFGYTHDNELMLCPYTYFDSDARVGLDKIWANSTGYQDKAKFPKICNGVFDGLDSIKDYYQVRAQVEK